MNEAEQVMNGNQAYMTFFNDEEEIIGELFAKDGIISFRGKSEESAQMFFDELERISTEKYLERQSKLIKK